MATTESHDPITTLYTNTSDTEEVSKIKYLHAYIDNWIYLMYLWYLFLQTTNMEVNVEDDEPLEEDVPHATTTTQSRPSKRVDIST